MSDTRQVILNEARRLFTERGFNGVSMRDIAEAVGISKGNLTYHFAKKETIVEALLDEGAVSTTTQASAKAAVTGASASTENIAPARLPSPCTTIAELDERFSHMQQVVQEKAFYFWHYSQMAQLSPKIRERQQLMVKSHIEALAQSLRNLQNVGLVRAETEPLFEGIARELTMAGVFWEPFKEVSGSSAHFRTQAWTVVAPLLTKEGARQVANLGGTPLSK